MSFKFNPFTGTLDIAGTSGGGSSFDEDRVLLGPGEFLYFDDRIPFDVLYDEDKNILVGE